MRDRGDELAMVSPRPARCWTTARRDLVNAAPVCVHNGTRRSARTLVQRVGDSITVFVGLVSLGAGMGYALGATVLGALRPRRAAPAAAKAQPPRP